MTIADRAALVTGANRGIGQALVSKAAALNMTQPRRALLAGQGVTVHAVVLGPIDTYMNLGFEIPTAWPGSAAVGTADGSEKAEDDIFPDRVSLSIAEGWLFGV